MNWATRAAIINFEAKPFQLRASFFHSTPVLERKRRNYWDYGGGGGKRSSWNPRKIWTSEKPFPVKKLNSSKRYRKLNSKRELLRDASAFAEHLFRSWKHAGDEFDAFASQNGSWLRQDFNGHGFKGAKSKKGGSHRDRRIFQFFEDDDEIEVETIFSSAFGGSRFYYSFINEEPQGSRHFNNQRFYWHQRHSFEEDYHSSEECDTSQSDMRSDRLALGLSSSGPLNLEDVKSAYRTCALKWHPDRHQGSSKKSSCFDCFTGAITSIIFLLRAECQSTCRTIRCQDNLVVAEEKFKACSAAYQSLRDKLFVN